MTGWFRRNPIIRQAKSLCLTEICVWGFFLYNVWCVLKYNFDINYHALTTEICEIYIASSCTVYFLYSIILDNILNKIILGSDYDATRPLPHSHLPLPSSCGSLRDINRPKIGDLMFYKSYTI